MSVMNTFTGRIFDPLKMTKKDVCVEDIAHALSLICRGGGHIRYFFSVAQHSMNCADEAAARGWSKRIVLACLLHDASEAYIADIIRPVKPHLSNYLDIEAQIMSVIYDYFGLADLTEEEKKCCKQIDDEMMAHELHRMMPGEENRPVPERSLNRISENVRTRRLNRIFLTEFINVESLLKTMRKIKSLSQSLGAEKIVLNASIP